MRSVWKPLSTPHGGALLAGALTLLGLLAGWHFLGRWYQANLIQQERARAAGEISARANTLAATVDQRIALLQGLYAFTRTEWPGSGFDQTFEVYSAGVYFSTTGVRTLLIAPEGVARYVFPTADASILRGYDILNDPDPATRSDVQRAVRTRGITLGQPGTLRQGGFGLTAWQAVYRGSELWGLVAVAVDMDAVMAGAGFSGATGELEMALRDNLGYTFYGRGEVWKGEPVIQSISLPEGGWELGGAPRQGWAAAVAAQSDIFRLATLVIAALIAALVYLTVNRQGRLAQAVAERTRQIAAAQEVLEQRVAERTHEISTLLEVSRRIGSTLAIDPLLGLILSEIRPVLDYARAGIYILDEHGGLVLASAAGEEAPPGGRQGGSGLDERLQQQVLAGLQPVIQAGWRGADGQAEPACWLGVPLVIKDRAKGMLVFIHHAMQHYRQEDARLALAFAQQVAVAVENARLYEQAGQVAVLEERQRLARELHDSVAQVLFSIGLGAKTARTALGSDPGKTAEALDYVNRLAEAGQVEMRALIFELRPESLRSDGLVAALEKQAEVLRTRHEMKVETSFCTEPEVPLAVKETVYRIAQEAMHNIVRHAQAHQVRLLLDFSGSELRLEVADDGAGFDPLAAYPGHLGLRSMRERAAGCGGQLEIESSKGQGTAVRLSVPAGRGE